MLDIDSLGLVVWWIWFGGNNLGWYHGFCQEDVWGNWEGLGSRVSF